MNSIDALIRACLQAAGAEGRSERGDRLVEAAERLRSQAGRIRELEGEVADLMAEQSRRDNA